MTDLLSIGRSALLAYSGALTTVGTNVANAQTPGYVRRSADLREVATGQGRLSFAGSGVRAAGVERQWNQFLADTARKDAASASQENIRHQGALQIETALDDGPDGIGQSMTGLFNAAHTLAADPSSAAQQAQFRYSVDAVTTAFRRSADAIGQVVHQSNDQIDAALATANDQLSDLASINQRIATAQPGSSEFAALADQRDTRLTALSGSIGATSLIDAHGRATVTLGTGIVPNILDHGSAATLSRDESGAIIAVSDRGTGNVHAVGGQVGGLLATIDHARSRGTEVDTLATDFVAMLNGWSAQGRTIDGSAGRALLEGSSAADVKTTAALADALPMSNAAGSTNGNLVALASLRQASGLEQRWDRIVANQAQMTATARLTADASKLLADGSATKLDAASAVDLDTEAADLVRYQQAYQAAAKVIKAADDSVSTILQLL